MRAGMCVGQLALANCGKAMVMGISEPESLGARRCYRFPLTSTQAIEARSTSGGNYATYAAHSEPITRLRMSYDDRFVFSVGEDGCVFVMDVRKNELLSLTGGSSEPHAPLAEPSDDEAAAGGLGGFGGGGAPKKAKKQAADTAAPVDFTELLPFADEILVRPILSGLS